MISLNAWSKSLSMPTSSGHLYLRSSPWGQLKMVIVCTYPGVDDHADRPACSGQLFLPSTRSLRSLAGTTFLRASSLSGEPEAKDRQLDLGKHQPEPCSWVAIRKWHRNHMCCMFTERSQQNHLLTNTVDSASSHPMQLVAFLLVSNHKLS